MENLPALADAAARGMKGANLTVLNGTNGVNEMAAGVVGQGLAILHSLQRSASAGKPAVDAKRAPRITDSN